MTAKPASKMARVISAGSASAGTRAPSPRGAPGSGCGAMRRCCVGWFPPPPSRDSGALPFSSDGLRTVARRRPAVQRLGALPKSGSRARPDDLK